MISNGDGTLVLIVLALFRRAVRASLLAFLILSFSTSWPFRRPIKTDQFRNF
jgi:hypothetical protein